MLWRSSSITAGGSGAAVWDSWVTRDSRHYRGTDLDHNSLVFSALIDLYFP